jgi:hypothetical protein
VQDSGPTRRQPLIRKLEIRNGAKDANEQSQSSAQPDALGILFIAVGRPLRLRALWCRSRRCLGRDGRNALLGRLRMRRGRGIRSTRSRLAAPLRGVVSGPCRMRRTCQACRMIHACRRCRAGGRIRRQLPAASLCGWLLSRLSAHHAAGVSRAARSFDM